MEFVFPEILKDDAIFFLVGDIIRQDVGTPTQLGQKLKTKLCCLLSFHEYYRIA